MDSRTPSANMCWIYLKCVCTSPFTFLICFGLFVIFLVTHFNPISIHCHLMGHAELHPLHQSHANDLAGLSRGVKETFKKAIGIKKRSNHVQAAWPRTLILSSCDLQSRCTILIKFVGSTIHNVGSHVLTWKHPLPCSAQFWCCSTFSSGNCAALCFAPKRGYARGNSLSLRP